MVAAYLGETVGLSEAYPTLGRRLAVMATPDPYEAGAYLIPHRLDDRGRPVFRVRAQSRPRLPCWLRMQIEANRLGAGWQTAHPRWDVS